MASAGVLQLKANGVPQTDVILGVQRRGRPGRAGATFRRRLRQPRRRGHGRGQGAEVLEEVKAAGGVGDAYLLAEGSVPITGAPGAPSAAGVRDGKV